MRHLFVAVTGGRPQGERHDVGRRVKGVPRRHRDGGVGGSQVRLGS